MPNSQRENELQLQSKVLFDTMSERCLVYVDALTDLNNKFEMVGQQLADRDDKLAKIKEALGEEAFNKIIPPTPAPAVGPAEDPPKQEGGEEGDKQ